MERKINIAMLGQKRIPSREGGVEVVAEQLAAGMVRRGHSVTCYNRSGHHVSGREFDPAVRREYRGIRLKKVPALPGKGLAAVSSSVFASLGAAFGKYDVVHYHGEGPCAMLWLPKLFGKRCIATIHGLDWQREKWSRGPGSSYIRFGERMAVRFADELIVLSRRMEAYFLETYGRKTRYIPNGITKPERCPPEEITRQFGLKGNDYILYLGRLVPEKGLRYLVRAYRELDTDKKLVIAGGVSDSRDFLEELKAMAAGEKNILFTGFVQGRVLQELYSSAYVYVLPSDLEGMPLSLLEAMSYGNCCVVSDIPECTEVVEDRSVIFRKGDTEDLREKLQALCRDEETVCRCRERSADLVCRKYDWDAILEETLDLYRGGRT